MAGAFFNAFELFRLAIVRALVIFTLFDAIPRLIRTAVSAVLLNLSVIGDAIGIRNVGARTVAVSKVIVTRAAVRAVRVARTVVAALVQVIVVASVFALPIAVASSDAFVANVGAVVNALLRLVAPNQTALFGQAGVSWFATPIGTGTSFRTLWVARAFVHAFDFFCSAKRFAGRVSVAFEGASVSQVGTLVAALLRNVRIRTLLETVFVRHRNLVGTVRVAEIVAWRARAAVLTVRMTGTVIATLLEVLSVAFVLANCVAARIQTIHSLRPAIVVAGLCLVTPDRFAFFVWRNATAPSRTGASQRTLGVAWASRDANVFFEAAVGKALLVAIAPDSAVIPVTRAFVSTLLRNVAVLLETVLVRLGHANRTVAIAERVFFGTGATVGAVSVAGAVFGVFGVFLIAVVFAQGGAAAFIMACFQLRIPIVFASLRLVAPNRLALIDQRRFAARIFGVFASFVTGAVVNADIFAVSAMVDALDVAVALIRANKRLGGALVSAFV